MNNLVGGSALQVEDLNVTMQVRTFDTYISRVARKHKGRTSKRRYENILKMARKRDWQRIGEMLKAHGKN